MKFYSIETDTEKGNSAIIDGPEPGYDYNNPNSQFDLSSWEFPNFEPFFSKLIFERGFKLVDFINPSTMGACGFVISERIKDIILKFDIMPHKIHQLPVYENKDENVQYYLLQLIRNLDDYSLIDFQNSSFYTDEYLSGYGFGKSIKKINIYNEKEFIDIRDSLDELKFEKIFHEKLVLKKAPTDIFAFHNINTNFPRFFISENLKNILQEIKVTGLKDFIEYEIHINQ